MNLFTAGLIILGVASVAIRAMLLRPVAMERTLEQLDVAARMVRLQLDPPCNAQGRPN